MRRSIPAPAGILVALGRIANFFALQPEAIPIEVSFIDRALVNRLILYVRLVGKDDHFRGAARQFQLCVEFDHIARFGLGKLHE